MYIPADVPRSCHKNYKKALDTITKGTNRCLLFAGDQKIEHLHTDFYGNDIAREDSSPKHLFDIASQGSIGAFATHLGLLSQYGNEFKNIPYIIKLNGKTNLVPTKTHDPQSLQLWGVEQVVAFARQSGLNIIGVGYTLYLGSDYEASMLTQAAQVVFNAHQHGLLALLWVYPRGKHVDPIQPLMLAGAAGVACALGADFVKLSLPNLPEQQLIQELSIAKEAAGRTKIIISGGAKQNAHAYLETVNTLLDQAGIAGCAVGRNLHQRSLSSAILLSKALSALIYDNASVQTVAALVTD